jgi:heptaprenyl diphosphate synthase
VGQILLAMWILETESLLYYLPVLMVSGIVAGIVIGLLSALITKRIKKI